MEQQSQSLDNEEILRKREQKEADRKQASIDMIADSIRRELAESKCGLTN